MAVTVARALGAGPILAVEVVPERQQMARQMGADYALDGRADDTENNILDATGGLGVGALIEASGAPSALALGMRVLRKGGKAVLFGLGTKPAEIDVARWIVSKELTLVGTLGRRMFDTWMRMETLVQKGVLNLDPVMGESFPLERFKEAFASALSGKTGKIFFAP
jgi:threonine 3-dehydrogenase